MIPVCGSNLKENESSEPEDGLFQSELMGCMTPI